MKTGIIVSFAFFMLISCQGQTAKEAHQKTKKDTTMIERFDFEDYKIRTENNVSEGRFYIKPDGTEVELLGGREPSIREIPPPPSFIEIYREFYNTGIIAKKETYLGGLVKIGISRYFDEYGNILKEVDEDKKFGKVKPDDILKFLEKERWINLKTGERRK